jgi:DNA polymerase-3 subunit gamma/tau
MGYRALARRYRPQTLQDLVGQDILVQTLEQAFTSQRIPQGIIFHGIRGVGKTTTARIIAKCLNCLGEDSRLTQPTSRPCGVCLSCQAIGSEKHMDVIEIDAASHTGVDDIRGLIESTRYKAVQGRYKAFIIDEAHMLSKSAFNALLKTLEEPPPHVVFMLATTEHQKIPDTIRSRCQQFNLQSMSVGQILLRMQFVLDQENVSFEPDALLLIARSAGGSMRDALSLCDQAIVLNDPLQGGVQSKTVLAMLGKLNRDQIFNLLRSMLSGNGDQVLSWTAQFYQDGLDPIGLLQDLLDVLYAMIGLIHQPNFLRDSLWTESEQESMQILVKTLSISTMLHIWQVLLKGYDELQKAPDPHQSLDVILLRVGYLASLIPLENLLSLPSPSVSLDLQSSTPISNDFSLAPQTLQEIAQLLGKAKEPILQGHVLHDLHLVSIQSNLIQVQLGPKAPPQLAQMLSKTLEKLTGHPWIIQVVQKGGGASLADLNRQQQLQKEKEIRSHPTVSKILTAFPETEVKILHKSSEIDS